MRIIDAEVLKKTITEEFHGISATGFIRFMHDKTPIEVYNKIQDLIDKSPTIESCYQTTSCSDCKMYDKEKHNCPRFCEVIRDLLKEVEERPTGEWIPVSEMLPDKNMACLVYVGDLHLTQIAMYSDLMGTISHKIFYQGDYGKNNFQNITEYVRAWMPLPEPYKEGE